MIRTANATDVRQIAETHVSSWKTTYIGQVPQSYLDGLSIPAREAAWSEAMTDPNHRILVAEDKGAIIGFSSFGSSRDEDAASITGELYAIYLTEEFKGKGIGKELWHQTVDALRALGFTKVTLWVLDSNRIARDFYERIGFSLDGAQKSAVIGGHEVVELRYRRMIAE